MKQNTCITESLCGTAKINTENQRYFNKISKKKLNVSYLVVFPAIFFFSKLLALREILSNLLLNW